MMHCFNISIVDGLNHFVYRERKSDDEVKEDLLSKKTVKELEDELDEELDDDDEKMLLAYRCVDSFSLIFNYIKKIRTHLCFLLPHHRL